MVIAVAVPFGRGVQSLWALQGLFGSTSVFGGDGDGFAEGLDPWADTPRLNIMLLGPGRRRRPHRHPAGHHHGRLDRHGDRPDRPVLHPLQPRERRVPRGDRRRGGVPRRLRLLREEREPHQRRVGVGRRRTRTCSRAIPSRARTATRWAVEETLGISTDYYAMVNLKGFEEPSSTPWEAWTSSSSGGSPSAAASEVEGYIEPGEQKLDGYHALWYAAPARAPTTSTACAASSASCAP